jgi:hypothetical protein
MNILLFSYEGRDGTRGKTQGSLPGLYQMPVELDPKQQEKHTCFRFAEKEFVVTTLLM